MPPLPYDLDRNVSAAWWHARCGSQGHVSCLKVSLRERFRVILPSHAPSHGNIIPRTVLGVPTCPIHGRRRRDVARATWMPVARALGTTAVFIVGRNATVDDREQRDILVVDAPETRDLYPSFTRYSGFRKRGRAMPTFKQHAFFVLALRRWPTAAFIGKVDDDTLIHPSRLLEVLARVDEREALVGLIHWGAAVVVDREAGVLVNRCLFGWNRIDALRNVAWGACDRRGATPPFPYAAGAAYVLTRALVRRTFASSRVRDWVGRASQRRDVEWQKNEDLTTGLWIARLAPNTTYRNLVQTMHDAHCSASHHGLYRAPDTRTVAVHGLKHSRARALYMWKLMRGEVAYDAQACRRATRSA